MDARDKVQGAVRFAADGSQPEIKHVALTVATIAKERIVSLDIHAASLILGVRLILIHLDLADVKLSG